MERIISFGFCVFVLLSMSGCGGVDAEFRPVSGTVTYGGAPLEGASVFFVPLNETGIAATGATDASGKYSLTSTTAKRFGSGAKPGQYRVRITKSEDTVNPDQEAFDKGEITYEELQERKARRGPYGGGIVAKDLIPSKYGNPLTSGLQATVEDKKSNEINFDLEN